MLSPEEIQRILDPHHEEMLRLAEETKKALETGNDNYAHECTDKIYSLLFDTSMITAKFISDLEERIEKEPFLKTCLVPIIKAARESYADRNESLKEFRRYQTEEGLTNAPVD